jgi:DNA-3-methyladenine glycosylase II
MGSFSMHKNELHYSPPYDWAAILDYFRIHALPNVEMVDDSGYERLVQMSRGLGWFRVEHSRNPAALSVSIWNANEQEVPEILSSVRRMFDLDVEPVSISHAMVDDHFLYQFWVEHPGLRLARSWSLSESLFATVLGQLVSVRFGRVLIGELMHTAGTVVDHPKTGQPMSLFPSAEQIIKANLSSLRTSAARRLTIRSLAEAFTSGAFRLGLNPDYAALRTTLRGIPGVGSWTTEYVALRGFGDNDAFPATDYALKQELKRHPEVNVNSVRPYRGYAAIAIWKSFAEESDLA